ncbi:MAG: hypothetical protein J4432_04080 [DPANN group archaeon]|nr:hypothetical protein [DPANN group archaeon]
MTTASLALTQKTFMLDPENPQFTFLENKFKDNSTIINFNNSGVKTKYIMLPKGAKITEASIALIGQAVQMKEENDISSNWYSPSDGPGGYYSTLFQMITINQTQIIDSIQIYVSGSYSGNRYQKFTVLKDWDRSNSQIPPSNNILASCEIDVYYSGWTPIGSCTNLNLTVQSGGYWIMHDGARSDRLYWKYSTDTYTGGMVGYYFFYFNQIQGMHLAFGTNSNNDMLIKVHGRAFPDNLRLSNEDNKTEFASTRLFNTNETLSLNISNIEEIINSCGTDECDVPINFEAGGVGGLTHTPNITFNMTLISSNVYQWENTDSLALNQSIKKTQTIGVYNYGVDTVLKKIKIPNSTATCIIDGQIQNVSNGECTIPQTTIQKGQIKQFTIWHDVLGKYNPLTSVIAARQQDPAKLTVPNEMSYSRQKITLINNETAYGMNGTTFTNINTETCIDSFTCLNDTLMSLGPNETKEWYVYFNKTAVWMNESIYQDPTRQTEINGTAYYLQEANLTNTDDIDYTINYNKSCIDSWGCDNNSLDLTLQPNSTLQHKILNTLENALFYKIDRREQDHSKETKLNSKAFTKRLVSIINSAALPFKNISWRVSADDGWNASIQNGTLDFNANSNVTFYIEQEHDSILTANYSDWVFTKTTFDEQALEQTITYQNNDNDLNYTIFDDNECYSTLDCTKIGNVTLQPGTTTKMLNVTSDLIDEKFEWRQDTQENSSIFKAHIQLNATINNMHPQNITNIALPITNRDMWNCSSLGTIDLEANTTHKPTHLVKCESQILQTGAFNNTWNSTPHSGIINITNETLLYLFEENESILTADYSEWEQTNITFENQILTQKITYQNNDKELNFTVLDNNDCYSTMNCSRIGNITITPGETTMEINSSGDLIYESFEWQQDYNRGSSINNIYIRLKAAITNNLDKDITNIALPITDRPEWNCTTQGTLNLTKNSTQNFSNTVDCNAQALNTIINDREQDQTMETKINGKAFTKKKISITNPDTLMYTNVSWELPADENWTPTFNTGTINITSNETIELYLEQEQDSLLTANYSGWEFSKLGFDQQILTKIIEYNNRDIMLNYTVQESVPCYMNMSCQNISGNITLAPGLSISEINSTGDMIEEKFEWIQDKQQNSSIFKAFIRLDANITNNLNKNITGITLPITNRTLWNCSSLGTIDLEANTTHKPTHLVKCESQILQTGVLGIQQHMELDTTQRSNKHNKRNAALPI